MTNLRHVWAAIKAGSWAPVVSALVTAAVTFGVLDQQQASAANTAVSSVATGIAAVIALVHTLRGVRLVKHSKEY